jgi:long-subunit fatty acid transport protein
MRWEICSTLDNKKAPPVSIASNFRAKWAVIVKASDDTFHSYIPDTRYAALAKAADDAGLILIEKAAIEALANRIKELEANAIDPKTTGTYRLTQHGPKCGCTDCT